MAVQSKQTSSDDKKDPGKVGASQQTQTRQDKSQAQPVSTRTGKEQDTIYEEQDKLLTEVKEKYKEADLEAQKQVEEALGKEAKAKVEAKIPPDVGDAGVQERDAEASNIVRKGSTVDLPITEDEYEEGKKTKVGGRRLINRNIVGVKSIVALAIEIGRLINRAHKHARKVIFKKSDSGGESAQEGTGDAG